MNIVATLLATALLATGCASSVEAPHTPTAAPAPTSTPLRAARATRHEIAADPASTLSAVSVRPTTDGYRVRAWWVLRRGDRTVSVIVSSSDGMRTPAYAPGTHHAWAAHEPPPVPVSPAPGMGGLVTTHVLSLAAGTRAQQGGHDGATLDPFERVARSTDDRPWELFDVPHTGGQQAYTSGQVVLPDGRLLALLDHWSGDRRGRANPVWHGLWISRGDDWSSYRPWRPRFSPALPAGTAPWGPLTALGAAADPGPGSGGVVWVTTSNRLYVSVDGAGSFRELPARPAA